MFSKIWIVLFVAFLCYTQLVYTNCDKNAKEGRPNEKVLRGWQVWQDKNCQSCHQLYGLGGYMGPDLTNVASAKTKGSAYMRTFIKYGTGRMPNFHLNDSDIENVIAFLSWIDKSGRNTVPDTMVDWTGNYNIEN